MVVIFPWMEKRWPRNGSMKLKKNCHSLLPILATILSLFLQQHSLAYQFTNDLERGTFWRTFPIPLKIQVAASDSRKDVTESALVEAIEEWQRHSEIQLWDYKGSDASANTTNVIRWSDNFQKETGYSAHSTMAITIRYSTPPLLIRTEIIINGQYAGLTDQDDLKKILIHELGHTIGLDHSNDQGSMMYATLSLGGYGPKVLSEDDIDGLSSVMNYHLLKQSQPIQLEQQRTGVSNPIDGIANCGQNNQDISSFSPAETEQQKNNLVVWLISLLVGLALPLSLLVVKFALYKVRKTNFMK
jgi:hypothetical protein